MAASGFSVHGAAPFQKTSRLHLRFSSLLSTSTSSSQLPRAAFHGQDQDAFYIVQGSAHPPAYRRHGQEPLEMLPSTDWTRNIALQTSRTEEWHAEIQNLKAKKNNEEWHAEIQNLKAMKNNVRHSVLNPIKLKGSEIELIAQRVDDYDDCHNRNTDAHVLFSSSDVLDFQNDEPGANNLSGVTKTSTSKVVTEDNEFSGKHMLGENRNMMAEQTGIESFLAASVEPYNANESPDRKTPILKPVCRTGISSANSELRNRLLRVYEDVLVVDSVAMAREVVTKLMGQYKDFVHACDTEVAKIDVKDETPINHGEIICFSIYSGKEANYFGKSCIWVDVLDGGRNVLMEFAPFFESPSIKKVWHNYSFDCHVIGNYGIKVYGFHADTMHLARLWDSSRKTMGGYSLEALTGDTKVMDGGCLQDKENLLAGKISMKSIFGERKIKKDGLEGKLINVAPLDDLQREERLAWISYSALDSISTLKLFESLKTKLLAMDWIIDEKYKGQLYNFYEEYLRPFGQLLVDMESVGMLVDRAYLAEMEKLAISEQNVAARRFKKWASKYCSNAMYMNVGSDSQLRQLFFGGISNSKNPDECLPKEKEFKVLNTDKIIEEGKKAPTKYRTIKLHNLRGVMPVDTFTPSGWPSLTVDSLKIMAGKVSADEYYLEEDSANNLDDVSSKVENSDDPGSVCNNVDLSIYGTAYESFGGGRKGKEACHAIAALCEICSIDSLISNFILPLQGSHISGKDGRIHCSLNLNTETGRLSARRPNLQNQPALEKDRYKIRQAFIAAPGNSLIVADYGQLELRILAHLTNCKSMLEAFKAGGDFHSRTAMNMYPYILEAVKNKEVLLECYPRPGEEKPLVPLLKDAFASERRKAKMLNFSIAYGKTPVGLSQDWKVSIQEAKRTVDLWYKERQEVLQWQESQKDQALREHRVRTLLGRYRHFPSVSQASRAQRGHIERAAINTPVQGSAADVAMCAMLEISRNTRLKELGWKLILQVHDEVILEGPTKSEEVAKAIVVDCMSKPFNGENFLKVDLCVDAKCAQTWYAAK